MLKLKRRHFDSWRCLTIVAGCQAAPGCRRSWWLLNDQSSTTLIGNHDCGWPSNGRTDRPTQRSNVLTQLAISHQSVFHFWGGGTCKCRIQQILSGVAPPQFGCTRGRGIARYNLFRSTVFIRDNNTYQLLRYGFALLQGAVIKAAIRLSLLYILRPIPLELLKYISLSSSDIAIPSSADQNSSSIISSVLAVLWLCFD